MTKIESCLAQGADIRCGGFLGWNALMLAAKAGHTKCARFLVKKKIPINAIDFNGDTALMMAVQNGHIQNAQMLVKKGANPLLCNFSGETITDIAQKSGNLQMCDLIQDAVIQYTAAYSSTDKIPYIEIFVSEEKIATHTSFGKKDNQNTKIRN